MTTQNELQKRVDQLEAIVARLTGRPVPPSDDPRERPDYVERGSDQHAAMLGLIRAEEDEQFQVDGWTLEDITKYGPSATTEYLTRVLRQQVNELTSEIPATQSVDPRKPNFAPVMFDGKRPFWQITED